MKILQIIPYFYPALNFGGPAKVIFELSRELAKSHTVTVFTSDAWDSKRRIKENEKITGEKRFQVYYFRNLINIFSYNHRIFTNFGILWEYFKQRDTFELVHVHDVFSLPQIFLLTLARLSHKPYVFSPHGTLDPLRMERKFLLKSLLYALFIRTLLSKAKAVIATSQAEAKDLTRLQLPNVIVVHNGVTLDKVRPSKNFSRYRTRKIFTILYIGKIHPLKGLDQVILALGDADFEYQLLIAGPNDGAKKGLQEIIKSKAIKNIHFLGYVDEKEKSELYSMADIFIYPSLSEGFSISILEAMRYKLPVLITEACHFPDVARQKGGFIISTEEIQNKVGKILKKAASQQSQLRKMGLNARAIVENNYSIEKMGQQMNKVYLSCLQ